MEDKKRNIEVETDFKDVVHNPLRWFGMIYPYMIIVIVIGGLFFIRNYGFFYVNEVKPLPASPENDKQQIGMKKGVQLAGVDINEISQPSDELINKGEELYQANCASCHGDQGLGDGAAGASLNPPPRDFTSNEGWINGRNISDMYKTLAEGIDGSGMTAYDYMPVKDRFAIIHYIRTLDNDFPAPDENALAALDRQYNLSEGRQASNTIPIDSALKIITAEYQPAMKKINHIHANIASDTSAQSQVFLDITNDRIKALTILNNNKTWYNDLSEFERIIESNIPVNGFKFKTLKLKNFELVKLHEFLKGFYGSGHGLENADDRELKKIAGNPGA